MDPQIVGGNASTAFHDERSASTGPFSSSPQVTVRLPSVAQSHEPQVPLPLHIRSLTTAPASTGSVFSSSSSSAPMTARVSSISQFHELQVPLPSHLRPSTTAPTSASPFFSFSSSSAPVTARVPPINQSHEFQVFLPPHFRPLTTASASAGLLFSSSSSSAGQRVVTYPPCRLGGGMRILPSLTKMWLEIYQPFTSGVRFCNTTSEKIKRNTNWTWSQ